MIDFVPRVIQNQSGSGYSAIALTGFGIGLTDRVVFCHFS